MTNTNFDRQAHETWKCNAMKVLEESHKELTSAIEFQKHDTRPNSEVLSSDIKDTMKEIKDTVTSTVSNIFNAYVMAEAMDNAIAEDENNFIDVEAKMEDIKEENPENINVTEETKEGELPFPEVNVTVQKAEEINVSKGDDNKPETKKAEEPKPANVEPMKSEAKKTTQEVAKPEKSETPKVVKEVAKPEATKEVKTTEVSIPERKEDASNTSTHEENSSESGTDEPVYEFEPDKADVECEALRHLEFAKGKFNFKAQFVDHMAATEELVEASRNLVTAWAGTLGYPMIDTTKVYGTKEDEWAPYVERAAFLLKNGHINQDEYDLLVRRISRQPRWDYFSMVPELNGIDTLFDRYFYNKYEWSKDLQKIVSAMNRHTEKRYGLNNKKNRGDNKNVAKSTVGLSQKANNGTLANADAKPQQSSNVTNLMNPLMGMANVQQIPQQPISYATAMNSVNPYMAMMNSQVPQQSMMPSQVMNPQMIPQQPMAPNQNMQMRPSNAFPQGYEMVPFA